MDCTSTAACALIIYARLKPKPVGSDAMDQRDSRQDLTDQQLVELCRRKDRAAQREVYDRTSERIYRLLLKITHNAEHAFDLAQDTYVRAFSCFHQFDGRASLATWLYSIAVNEALQFVRRQAIGGAKLRELPHTVSTGSDAERVSTKLDVTEALATLPAEERTLLLLRYQDGLGYAEIADMTGLPSGTVASRLNRARAKLRDSLRAGYGNREESAAVEHPMDKGSAAEAGPEQTAQARARQSGAVPP